MAKKSVHHLPEELITEILLRLPVKYVLRCRCVCKLWLSLISHPNFATSHYQLAASPTHKLLFIDYYAIQTLSIDFHASLDDDSAFSLSPGFLHPGSPLEIGGSCRGFLFLNCFGDFYLWNPSTGVHKQIPASPITITAFASMRASNKKDFQFLYGFGYDMSSDDYRLVLGSYKDDYEYFPSVLHSIDLEIYSLRANEWVQIEFDSDFPYTKSSQIGLLLNGSIHWLVYDDETHMKIILAFDLEEMNLSEIALPNDFYTVDFHPIMYDLLVFGGLISVCTVKKSTLNIWVMQEYDVHSSWTKTFDFSFHTARYFCPVVCFTNGGDIVGPVSDGGLAKLDDEGDLLEYHKYGSSHLKRSQMAVYTESLLSLPGGTEQA